MRIVFIAQQTFIAFDQTVNAVFGGWADETISARSYRCRNKKRRWMITMYFINILFFWQNHHCREAHESELKRRHLPPHYRD